ncbi:MAG: EthD domain-containing protein, partial [Bacteroidales bacterium]
EIYLIRGDKNENYNDFRSGVMALTEEVRKESNPGRLKVTLTETAPPSISIIPFKKKKIAVISVYKESATPVEILVRAMGFSGAFVVEEAMPVVCEKTWPDGEATPGVCLLTLFHRKPGISYDAFIDRWHNSHTPLTLKLHPLTSYNRNVVLDKITDHPAWYDGIVEEQTRTRPELLNPFKFFGKPHRLIQNMLAVYLDTKSFLDYKKIETYLAAEYRVVSTSSKLNDTPV